MYQCGRDDEAVDRLRFFKQLQFLYDVEVTFDLHRLVQPAVVYETNGT